MEADGTYNQSGTAMLENMEEQAEHTNLGITFILQMGNSGEE